MQLFHQILKRQKELADLQKTYFFHHVLFSAQWWLLVLLMLIIWIGWALLVDKKRLKRILLVGLISMGFALILDDIGLSTRSWNYPYRILYYTSRFELVDMAILPVAFMFIYQWGRTWISYITFTILFSLFAAFVAEPIFVHLNMYTMIHWKHIYSAPIYTGIGIIVKGFTDLVSWIEQKARGKYDHPK